MEGGSYKADHLSAIRFLHSVVWGILEIIIGCLYPNICKQYLHIYSSMFIWVKVISRFYWSYQIYNP